MIRLWGRKSSINVQKVLWCLAELGMQEGKDFERIDQQFHQYQQTQEVRELFS